MTAKKIQPNAGEEYVNSRIINIRRGKGERSKFIYAMLVDKNGEMLINADLPYIMKALKQRLPK